MKKIEALLRAIVCLLMVITVLLTWQAIGTINPAGAGAGGESITNVNIARVGGAPVGYGGPVPVTIKK